METKNSARVAPIMLDPYSSERRVGDHPGLVLIVEDEPEIAEILQAYLARDGLRTARAADGAAALALHQSLRPDLVLLDVQLPKVDGWQVLAGIRHASDTPVIMLTARDQDVDKLTGLRIGADDYVVKPFNPAEVVARVQAVMRRSRGQRSEKRILRVPPFEIDEARHEALVVADGKRHVLELTLTEFRLLEQLLRAPGRVYSRTELLASCLPEGDALERTVDSHISKLRRKLDDVGVGNTISSVRGVGYRFESAP